MINYETAKKTTLITQKTRDFFTKQNFLEVQTPILTPIPGMEPHLTPFETALHHTEKSTPLYLNTSPELQMKKLLSQGFPKIFNLTKTFRDTEIGGYLHNPEFTMLEWYRANASYTDIMKDCENLIEALARALPRPPARKSPLKITYQNREIDLTPPFQRISVYELFLEYTKIDLIKNRDYPTFKKTAQSRKHSTQACLSWDDIFFKIFLNEIEPHLGFPKPTIIFDYPSSQAALARKSPKNPFWAERFELYIAGMELANAFSELINEKEQRIRLKQEQNQRKKLKKTVFPIDEEFIDALKSIKKPCAGIALGMDRLIMLLLDKKSIEDILHFPMPQMLNQIDHGIHNINHKRNRNSLKTRRLARDRSPIR